ncbi:hypothetical protein Q9233_015147 [Columba guinea]|nr:hypothetical protein Q9233_015147 [Columba guinea]
MSRGDTGLPMALVLGAVLLVTGATAVSPALPAPRDLARSVLETHGQELRLLKVLGVARTQPGGSTQPRTPGTPGAAGTSAGHPSSSSSSSPPRPPPRPRPPTSVSLLGTSRRPLSPAALE